ncbi:TonB-dependent receptor [Flammeovirgaceae bacterium SG7u.111]|nr:TonB-dependent receptor [Flammeovirgaceae bacterium SG7u.132]WPO37500.1 TonB-dependent receptor [Flammeovirgaceae bacterium SG7u.111]
MYLRNIVFILMSFAVPGLSFAQDCFFSIKGVVQEQGSDTHVPFTNIVIEESKRGVMSDVHGTFELKNVCKGDVHLIVSYIGYETQKAYFKVDGDTSVVIRLSKATRLLNEVSVVGMEMMESTQEVQMIREATIAENANQNLGNMLESIAGVSTLRTGSTISKPVVHGMYGNRLTILNNGVAQSGQQWGADHAPEIDPWSANKLTVVKGAAALEYQGSNLGSVVMIDPKEIDNEPHLHGKGSYFYESNGRGHGVNMQLEQDKWLAWRAVGTVKKSGDKRSPNYFLTNTGHEEANFTLQLEKSITPDWKTELYLSTFNSNLGILRGSHIGNLTDSEDAFEREVPFHTKDYFSYDISAPYQKVNHHLVKFHTGYAYGETAMLDFTYAGQLNLRKEFDVRRSGRSDMPALSLEQFSHFFEFKFEKELNIEWLLKTGVQLNSVNNTNLPETGILPLIPDYVSNKTGVFAITQWDSDRWFVEFGGRFDYDVQRVAAISQTVPREIIRYNNLFANYSASGGASYELSPGVTLAYNIGLTSRNPEVNELYSNGVHQGVGGIEEGDPNLKKENSFKNTFSIKANSQNRLMVDALVYWQKIDDFIYLNPQDTVRLTIRGVFPVFKYEQTDAVIYGLDFAATYKFTDLTNAVLKYSYLKGWNEGDDLPLINMPSNNIFAAVNYILPKAGRFENITLELNNRYVFEQRNLLPSQDYAPPPKGYNLVGAKVSAEKQLGSVRLNTFAKAENLLNQVYRDYLNRWRYFADDLGINVVLGVSLEF